MIDNTMQLRLATPADDLTLAELVNMSGDGAPLHNWSKLAHPDRSAWDIGRAGAATDLCTFSWRNTILMVEGEAMVGGLMSFPLPDTEIPPVPGAFPMNAPVHDLKNLALGTWYVSALAVYPQYRGRGFGRHLLGLADTVCTASGKSHLSLIVSDGNIEACSLYEACGYRELARRPIIKEDWRHEGQNWLLLVKAVSSACFASILPAP